VIWIVSAATLIAVLLIALSVESARRRTRPVKGGIDTSVTLPHEAEFELYGNAFSHCSRKTRLVFAELGIPFRHRPVDLIETGCYENIRPAYLRVNPAGLLPVLIHRGHPVYESDDILIYAAAQAPPNAPTLVPASAEARVEMQQWIDFCSLSSESPTDGLKARAGACIPGLTVPLFAAMMPVIPSHRVAEGLLFHPDKGRPIFFLLAKYLGLKGTLGIKPVRKMIRASRNAMKTHLSTLEAALAESIGPYILGAEYSLADVTLGCLLKRLDETCWLEWFHKHYPIPRVLAYYSTLKSRPGWEIAISNVSHPAVKRSVARLRKAVDADREVRRMLYEDS